MGIDECIVLVAVALAMSVVPWVVVGAFALSDEAWGIGVFCIALAILSSVAFASCFRLEDIARGGHFEEFKPTSGQGRWVYVPSQPAKK